MSPEYPSPGMTHLVRRLQNSDVSEIDRDWTVNDESARQHHGKVSLNESPLKLRLSWKQTPRDFSHLVGLYELDLSDCLRLDSFVLNRIQRMKSDCASIMDMTI